MPYFQNEYILKYGMGYISAKMEQYVAWELAEVIAISYHCVNILLCVLKLNIDTENSLLGG